MVDPDESYRTSAMNVVQLAYDTARLRIMAGHHPDDVMMAVWQILEAWVRVNVDGAFPPYSWRQDAKEKNSSTPN